MKLTNVIKNIAFEKVKSLKGDKVLNNSPYAQDEFFKLCNSKKAA